MESQYDTYSFRLRLDGIADWPDRPGQLDGGAERAFAGRQPDTPLSRSPVEQRPGAEHPHDRVNPR